jgi:tetratricopeptide (TPR) repeat protein
LSDSEALEFLGSRLGRQRVAEQHDAVAVLLRCCDGLPLALSVVAARAVTQPDRSLPELAAELNEDTTRLDALNVGEVVGDLRRVLSWSYDALATDTARTFRQLSFAPGSDVSIDAAAGLLGLDRAATTALLRQLVATHLLRESAGRYQMHDLVRLFAAELSSQADTPTERSDAVKRVCEWYLRNADRVDRILAPYRAHVLPEVARTDLDVPVTGYEQAMRWYDGERGNLASAVHSAAEFGHHELAWQLPLAAFGYYRISQHWREWLDLQQVALVAARTVKSEYAEAWVLNALGIAHTGLRQYSDATAAFEGSLAIRRRIGDRVGEGQVLNNLSELARRAGRYDEAIRYAQADQKICRETNDKYGSAISFNNLGKALLCARRAEEALAAPTECAEPMSRGQRVIRRRGNPPRPG